MPICPSGSQPQTGVSEWFTFEEADIANFAPPLFGFLTYALMGIPTAPQNTDTFCTTPPDGDLPTLADYAKLAFPPLALLSGTYRRFGNQLKQAKFSALCECLGGSTGTYPSTPCRTETVNITVANTTAPGACYKGSCRYWPATGAHSFPSMSAHKMRVTVLSLVGSGNFTMYGPSTGEGWIGFDGTLAVGNTDTKDFATTDADWNGEMWGNSGDVDITLLVEYFPRSGESCTSLTAPPAPPPDLVPPFDWPSPPSSPSCGSYQDICDALPGIQNKLLSIEQMVTLIQRQHVPFAYLLDTPSTGLTGTGSISAQGILGVLVSLTTVPSAWGSTAETPRRLIPAAGSVQAASSDGSEDNHLIHYEDQVVMLTSPWVTSVEYNFRPGIVATVTPIRREF